MTAPREILPGSTWMISRACTQRLFLLKPDEDTNEIFSYCLGDAAARYNVQLIAWAVMSNHYHAVVHDPSAQLPAFIEHLHKLIAKVQNARLERWENLWATEETCLTRLASAEDVFRKVVYVLCNPVADHLVDRAIHWPGCSSIAHLFNGKATVHAKPRWFFRPDGKMPATATLAMAVPESVRGHESADAWRKRVLESVAAEERTAAAERDRTGRRIVGRRRILESDVSMAGPPPARRTLRPAVAAISREERIAELRRLVGFRVAHETARRQYIAGAHTIEFPPGTYRMRLLGAVCSTLPPHAA